MSALIVPSPAEVKEEIIRTLRDHLTASPPVVVDEDELAVVAASIIDEVQGVDTAAIRAQVYAEIRQLAAESGATYEVRRPCSCGASHCRGVLLDAHAQFADLIPGGETDGDDA